MATATGSVLEWNQGRKTVWSTDGWRDLDTAPYNSGQYSALGGTYNHRVCFKVKMPTFTGTATKLTFTWYGKKGSDTSGTTYAVIHSSFKEFNDTSVAYTSGALGTGSMSYNSTSWAKRSIDITLSSSVTSGGTYYIYLYTNSTGVVYRCSEGSEYYSLTLTYDPPKTFNIYFDAQGGTVSPSYITKTHGVAVNLPTPVREGYEFKFWADNPPPYYSAEYYSPFNYDFDEDLYLYAYWESSSSSYTVNHYTQNSSLNGYDLHDTETLTGTTGDSINVANQQNQISGFSFNSGEVYFNEQGNMETLSSRLPETRQNAASARVGNYIYLFGGYGENTIVEFDISTEEAYDLYPTLPDTSENISAAAVGDIVYLFGGSAAGGAIRTFDTTTYTLSTLSTTLPASYQAMGAAAVGTKIYLFGGYASGASTYIYEFDTGSNSLTRLSATLPAATYQMGAAAVGTKIYLFGGWNGSTIYNAIRVFDTQTKTITTLSTTLPLAARAIFANAVGKTIYLFGGYNGGSLTTIYSFNTEDNTINTSSFTLPVAGCFIAGASVENKVYILGGYAIGSYIFKFTADGPHSIPMETTTILGDGSRTINLYYNRNTYAINYNANGRGTAPSGQTKIYGVDLTLRPFINQQTATGYKVSFNANGGNSTPSTLTSTIYYDQTYWNTNSSGTGTNYSSGGAYGANSAATLYAIWKTTNGSVTLPSEISRTSSTAQYTISYNANGGTSTPSNQSITRTTPYTFKYWTNAEIGGTQYAASSSYTPTADITLYAQWNRGTTTGSVTLASAITKSNTTQSGYTVTFNANGGTCNTTSLTATDTVKWTFSKWNTNSSGTGTDYSAGITYAFDSNVTLYAKWTSSISARGSITLPTPTRAGHTFKGWATSTSASSGSTGSYTPSGNVTLYAIWQINTWTVSYNANGHGTAPSSQTKTYGTDLTLRSFISQQTGSGYTVSFNANGGSSAPSALISTIYYDQTYWNTNSSGTGTNYSSGGTYTSNSGATLYAIWKTTNGAITLPSAISRASENSTGYTVTFNANGGICGTESLTATNTVNYTFNKWAAGSASGTQYSAGTNYTPNGSVTMYATWNSSTINGSITLPTPTRVGYTFMGWSTSSTATSGTTGSYTPSGNVILYAAWKANGAVQIGTGSGHQMALVYIHNGNTYVLAIPYVHDGTDWKMAIGG